MEKTDTLNKIIQLLKEITNNDKRRILGIVNPLEKEIDQKQMLDYLIKNRNNKELMRTDNLIIKSFDIIGESII